MRKLLFYTLLGSLAIGEGFASDPISSKILQTNNWAFYGTENPRVKLSLSNNRKVDDTFDIKCEIRDFLGNSLYDISQSGNLGPLDSTLLSFSFKTLQPGFYNVLFYDGDRFLKKVNVAKEPEKIGDAIQEHLAAKGGNKDFVYLANIVALQRRELRPQYSILRNKDLSGKEKNVYNFSMVSRGDEKVEGYIAFPKGKKALQLILTVVPLEERMANPLADFTAPAESAEMVVYLKQRGAGEEMLKNILTDMLLCIDYVKMRPEINPNAIYVQGKGYGAACALVASALDNGVKGSFAESPQLDIFTQTYSIESIASHISSPVLIGTGLQREPYQLQEIFSIYNKVSAPKEYFVIPDSNIIPRDRWKYIRDVFILRTREE